MKRSPILSEHYLKDWLILFILGLIALELTTTLWLVPFSATAIWITTAAVLVCGLSFWGMLAYRTTQTKR